MPRTAPARAREIGAFLAGRIILRDVSHAVAPSTEPESLPNPDRDLSDRPRPRLRALSRVLAPVRSQGNLVPASAPLRRGGRDVPSFVTRPFQSLADRRQQRAAARER